MNNNSFRLQNNSFRNNNSLSQTLSRADQLTTNQFHGGAYQRQVGSYAAAQQSRMKQLARRRAIAQKGNAPDELEAFQEDVEMEELARGLKPEQYGAPIGNGHDDMMSADGDWMSGGAFSDDGHMAFTVRSETAGHGAALWTKRLMFHIGVLGDHLLDQVKYRERPRVFHDKIAQVLYVGDEKYGGVSFMYFDLNHYMRRGAIMLLNDYWYLRGTVFLIFIHSVSSLFQDGERNAFDEQSTIFTSAILIAERIITIFFILEFVLVALANGIRRSLKSPFVVLDVLVIIVALLLDILPPDNPAMLYIHILNSLRPIRAVRRIPSMKKLVLVVIACLPTMASVVVLLFCITFIFSMAGVILFSDVLHNRCNQPPQPGETEGTLTNVCRMTSDQWDWLFTRCAAGSQCESGSKPPSRWENYDHIGKAILSIIQVITLDNWATVAMNVMDGWSTFAGLFFFLLTMVGAFWALNLLLAVITDSFSRFFAEEQIEIEQRGAVAAKPGVSAALMGELGKMDEDDPIHEAQRQEEERLQAEEAAAKAAREREEMEAQGGPRRGTGPLVRRQWRRWIGAISVASTRSLKTGLVSLDVESHLNEYDDARRYSYTRPRSGARNRGESILTSGNLEQTAATADEEAALEFRKRTGTLATGDYSGSSGSYLIHFGSQFDDDAPIDGFSAQGVAYVIDPTELARENTLLSRAKNIREKSRWQRLFEWRRDVVQEETEQVSLKQEQYNHNMLHIPLLMEEINDIDSQSAMSSFVEMGEPLSVHDRSIQLRKQQEDALKRTKRAVMFKNARMKVSMAEGSNEMVMDQDVDDLIQVMVNENRAGGGLFGKYASVHEGEKKDALFEKMLLLDAELARQEQNPSFFSRFRTLSTATRDTFAKAKRRSFRVTVSSVLRTPGYDRFLMLLVLFNALFLISIHYNQPTALTVTQNVLCALVDSIVIIDCITRLWLAGITKFFRVVSRNMYNWMEFIVVLLCVVDLFLVVPGFVPVLRILRVLRALKFMKRFMLLRKILNLVRTSAAYLIHLLGLMFIFTIVCTVCGRHVFAGSSKDPTNPCTQYREETVCNVQDNCVWVNQTEWVSMPWDYYIELKDMSLGISNDDENGAEPVVSTSVSMSDNETDPLSPAAPESIKRRLQQVAQPTSDSPAASTTTDTNASTPSPRDIGPPYFTMRPRVTETKTIPLPSKPLGNFSCRQFRGWMTVSATERFNFDTFYFAFLTVFNLLTLDNWSQIMYKYMTDASPFSCLFFFLVIAIGGYVLMSLFVAILLVNFGKDDQKLEEEAVEELDNDDEDALSYIDPETRAIEKVNKMAQDELKKNKEEFIKSLDEKKQQEEEEKKLKQHQQQGGGSQGPTEIVATDGKVLGEGAENDEEEGEGKEKQHTVLDKIKVVIAASGIGYVLSKIGKFLMTLSDAEDWQIDLDDLEGSSFFFFNYQNRFRLFCAKIVRGDYFRFERIVFLFSLLHIVVAPINEASVEDAGVVFFIRIIDYIITIISCIEMVARLVAIGGVLGQKSLWKSRRFGDKADAIAVLVSTISILIEVMIPATFFQDMAYALRSIRCIRLVQRSRAMSNVLFAVWKTVPAMLNVLGLSAIIYLIMSVICVELWQGRMRTCNDGSDRSEAECIGHWRGFRDDGVSMPSSNMTSVLILREWKNFNQYHFDNCFNAFSTLMEVAMVSQWSDPMYAMMDSPPNLGDGPRRLIFTDAAWLFIFWVFLSNFVLLNIFVGTVVDNFARLKLEMAGSLFLTEEQTEVAHIKKLLHQSRAKKVLSVPTIPFINHALNKYCHKVATSAIFVTFMRFVVIINCVVITTSHYQQPQLFTDMQFWCNVAFSIMFTIEMATKVLVSGPRAYLAIAFHRLDAVIVIQSWVEITLFTTVPGYEDSQGLQLFRLLRVLRLVREQKGFRRLLHSGYRSLPAMANVGALLVLVFYTFSMVGISLFNSVRFQEESRYFLSQNLNFRTFPKAMFALYRVATLDDWGVVSRACGLSEPYCSEEAGDCGNKTTSRIYFNVFIITCAFVMLNLFIAVVLENFSESVLLPTYMHERMQDVNLFRSVWASSDPAGRQVISASDFVKVLRNLPGPRQRLEALKKKSGVGDDDNDSICSWTAEEMEYYAAHCAVGLKGEPKASIIPTLRQLDLHITMPKQEVLFADAIDAIGEKIFHVKLVDRRTAHVHDRAKMQAMEYHNSFHIVEHYCAEVIQAGYRRYRAIQADPVLKAKAKSRSHWDDVLVPILQQVWAHHAEGVFDKDETEEERARFRRMVRGHRRKDKEDQALNQEGGVDGDEGDGGTKGGNDDGDGSPRDEASPHIKKKLTVTEALKARMAAVDEEEEVVEDLSWMTAIEDVESEGSSDAASDGEEYWLTDEALALVKVDRQRRLEELRASQKRREAQHRLEKHVTESDAYYTRHAGHPGQTKKNQAAREEADAKEKLRNQQELADAKKHVSFILPLQFHEDGHISQLPTLSQVIQRRKKQLAVELGTKGKKLRESMSNRSRSVFGAHHQQMMSAPTATAGSSPTHTGSAAEPQQHEEHLSVMAARLPHNVNSAVSLYAPYKRRWKPMPQPPARETIPFEQWQAELKANKLRQKQSAIASHGHPEDHRTQEDMETFNSNLSFLGDDGSSVISGATTTTGTGIGGSSTVGGSSSIASRGRRLRAVATAMTSAKKFNIMKKIDTKTDLSESSPTATSGPAAEHDPHDDDSPTSRLRTSKLRTRLRMIAALSGAGRKNNPVSAATAAAVAEATTKAEGEDGDKVDAAAVATMMSTRGGLTAEDIEFAEAVPSLDAIIAERRVLRAKRLDEVGDELLDDDEDIEKFLEAQQQKRALQEEKEREEIDRLHQRLEGRRGLSTRASMLNRNNAGSGGGNSPLSHAGSPKHSPMRGLGGLSSPSPGSTIRNRRQLDEAARQREDVLATASMPIAALRVNIDEKELHTLPNLTAPPQVNNTRMRSSNFVGFAQDLDGDRETVISHSSVGRSKVSGMTGVKSIGGVNAADTGSNSTGTTRPRGGAATAITAGGTSASTVTKASKSPTTTIHRNSRQRSNAFNL